MTAVQTARVLHGRAFGSFQPWSALEPRAHRALAVELSVRSRESLIHAALRNHAGCVGVGADRMPAARTDRSGLRGLVVRGKVATRRTVLRAVLRWHGPAQIARSQRLVCRIVFRLAQC